MVIVSDTSVITNLYKIEVLHILKELFEEIIIPPVVYKELSRLPTQIEIIDKLDWIKVEAIQDVEQFSLLCQELDAGESEAIVLALELNADVLLIDERKGRRKAKELGLEITGLLGALLEAKIEGIIDNVRPLMDDLIYKAEFRISPKLYAWILREAGE